MSNPCQHLVLNKPTVCKTVCAAFLLVSSLAVVPVKAASSTGPSNEYFELKLKVGQTFGTVFQRTVSYEGGGIDPLVGRVSGTAKYEVLDASSEQPVFRSFGHYDGKPQSDSTDSIRDHGKLYCPKKTDKCVPDYETSGATLNSFIWGWPAGKLKVGETWNVSLDVPWELGPPGRQTITVLAIDTTNHQITLKREGSGTGWFADDRHQMKVKREGKEYDVDITPGETHWTGISIFREGLTISDEVLETRKLTISSKEFGTATVTERGFTILNQCPAELL